MVNFPSAVEFLVRADRELTKNQYDKDIVALLYVADRYFRETLRLQDDPEAFFSQLLTSEMDFLGYLEKSNVITKSLFGKETDYGALRERLQRIDINVRSAISVILERTSNG